MKSKSVDHIDWPVTVEAQGDTSAATQLFRLEGQLYLTIIVKAALALVPNGIMTRMSPPPIVWRDIFQGQPGTQSLIVASDYVPTRARTDVWLMGPAYTPGQRPATTSMAALTIYRRRAMVLHKAIAIRGDVDSSGRTIPFTTMPLRYERALRTDENPVGVDPQRTAPNLMLPQDPNRAAGFGPISSYWPGRRRYLGNLEPRQADYDFPDLPRDFDVRYFQAAPADQQVPYLAGDESIVLEGLHPEIERLTTYLPRIRAQVSLSSKGNSQAQDVPVCLDTLSINTKFHVAYVIFRGYLPIRESLVGVLRASASIEMAEKAGSSQMPAHVTSGGANVPAPAIVATASAPPSAAASPSSPPPPPATPPSTPPPAPVHTNKPSNVVPKHTVLGALVPSAPAVPFISEKQESEPVERSVPKVDLPESQWSGQTFVGALKPDAVPLPFVQSPMVISSAAPAPDPRLSKQPAGSGKHTFVGTLQPDLAPLPFVAATPEPAPTIAESQPVSEKPQKRRGGQTMMGTLQSQGPALPFMRSEGPTAASMAREVEPTVVPPMPRALTDAAEPSVPAMVVKPASLIGPNLSKSARGPKKKRFKAMGRLFLAAVDECTRQEGASS